MCAPRLLPLGAGARALTMGILLWQAGAAGCGGRPHDDDGDGLLGADDPCEGVANPLVFRDVFDGTQPVWATRGGAWHVGPTRLLEEAVVDPDGGVAFAPVDGVADAWLAARMRVTDRGEGAARFGAWTRALPAADGRPAFDAGYACLVEIEDAGGALVLERREAGASAELGRAAIAPPQAGWLTLRLGAAAGAVTCALLAPAPARIAAHDGAPLPAGTAALQFVNARGETESVELRALPPACPL